MHYFIALSILTLAVLPALLSLAAGLGYNSALLPLRNWELLVFLVGGLAIGSWYSLVGATPRGCPGQAQGPAPTRTNVIPRSRSRELNPRAKRGGLAWRSATWQSRLPWLFLMSAMLSTLVSGADLYQFWSMPFLTLLVWLMLYSGLARTGINPFPTLEKQIQGRSGLRPDHVGAGLKPAPTIITAIQIAALLNAAMAILQLMGINPFFKPAVGERFITGFFDNPNRLGAFMAVALPLFFNHQEHSTSSLRGAERRRGNLIYTIAAIIIGAAVLLSRSTFAILAMLTAILYFVCMGPGLTPGGTGILPVHTGRDARATKTIPILIAAAFAVILIISVFLLDRPSRANLLRWHIYKKSVSSALERPISGHGLGQFDRVFNSRQPEIKDPPRRVTHAHNEYLELFVEQGLLGLSILTIFIWQLFCRSGVAPPGMQGRVTLPLRASLIALMVNALGFYPMRVPLIALTAVIILAGLINDHRQDACAT